MQYTVKHERQYKVLVGGYADEEHARKALKKIRRFISSGAFLVKDEHPAAERTVILY